jgi:WD40 repeat protein/class 3 adenylate cyclase
MIDPNLALQRRDKVEEFRCKHRVGLLTLLFTDIVGSTKLKQSLGDTQAVQIIQRHHAALREILRKFPEGEEIETAGDSFFIVFTRPSDAVAFALLVQSRNRELAVETGRPVLDRIGIHVGEVLIGDSSGPGEGHDLYGLQVDTCARVQSLGEGDQILMTEFAFDCARQILKGMELDAIGPLSWLHHGPYRMKGVEEPLDVCEVGEVGKAALVHPADSEKAHRFLAEGSEPVLGWRPAMDLPIPGTSWVLEKKLGEGGFGEVWLGRDKILKSNHVFKFCFHADQVRSLKREVTLFRMLRDRVGEHPNIVAVEATYFEEPPFYIVVQYVDAASLPDWCEAHGGVEKIPLAARLEIVAQAADALQAAHDSGIIHRDVKPANILVGGDPGAVQVHLTDFGIGQVLNEKSFGNITRSGFTQTMMEQDSQSGTQLYMAPELLCGELASIRSDIYSLGVVLYQLLTGDLTRPVTTDWSKHIADPLLRCDLEHCFAGDPQERFAGAKQLAEHLRSLDRRRAALAEEQAQARAREHAAFLRGMMRAAAVGGLVVAGIAVLAVYAGQEARRAEQSAAAEAVQRNEIADKNAQYQQMLVRAASSDRQVAQGLIARNDVHDALAHLARACEFDPDSSLAAEIALYAEERDQTSPVLSILGGEDGAAGNPRFSPDGRRIVTASTDQNARVWDADSGKLVATLAGHTGLVTTAVFSPDGSRIVTASNDGTARVWDPASGKPLATLMGHDGNVREARFNPDGSRIVTASDDKTARIWDATSGKLLVTLTGHTDEVLGAQFSPDGKRVLTASRDNTARLWDAATGALQATLQGSQAAFSADGTRIVSSSGDSTSRLWDAATGKLLSTLQGSPARFSPDGTRIVTDSDNIVLLWDAATGNQLDTFLGDQAEFSPDGTRIVTNSDNSAVVWDAASGRQHDTFAGSQARFSPDGARIVTVSDDGTATVWDTASCKLLSTLRLSPDGSRIVAAYDDSPARVFDTARGALLFTLDAAPKGDTDGINTAEFSPDGRYIASASYDKTALVWDAGSGGILATLRGHDADISSVRFSPDGKRIVTASGDKTARVWDAATGTLLTTLTGHAAGVSDARFSPDGSRVVTASADKTARVWDSATGNLLTTLSSPTDPADEADSVDLSQRDVAAIFESDDPVGAVSVAQFSPDGSRIVTNSLGNKIARLWDASSGKLLLTLRGHESSVTDAQFSADGSHLVTASYDGSARVWNIADGKPLATFQPDEAGSGNWVFSARFSPDGKRILTASTDKTARVWDLASGKLLTTFAAKGESAPNAESNPDAGVAAQFSPDGLRILTASENETAQVWEAPAFSQGPPRWFPQFLRWLGRREFNSDGELVDIHSREWQDLKAQIAKPALADRTRYGQVAQWFLLGPGQRPIRPGSSLTQKQLADELITPQADLDQIQRAYDLDPMHPLLQLALARFEQDPQRSKFLRQYSLKRLPETAENLRRAAELLAAQNQAATALEYANRALKLHPGDVAAARLRDDLASARQ